MRDLTQGPIPGHLLTMAAPIALFMVMAVSQALIFTCSGVFQGLGHTLPALASSASRILTFMLPAFWISTQPWLAIDHVWYLSVASVWLQAAISAGSSCA